MADKILPVEDHIKLIVFGEAHKQPCDTCKISELEHSLPPWYNKEMYKRGQTYIKQNATGVTTATVSGVLCVASIPTINNILMKTQRSSTQYSAYRRYLSTIMHFQSWYVNDLVPESDAWKSLSTVRERHIKWSNVSKLRKDGHISQRDLVLTITALGGLGLIRSHLLAIDQRNHKDLEAFCHFWRTIGYMLGIEDRYNAFRPSVEETQLVIEALCYGVYKPLMENPAEYFYHMTSVFIRGLSVFDPMISEGAIYYFTYRLVGCEGFEYYPKGVLEVKQKNEIKLRQRQLRNIEFKKGLGYSNYPGKNEDIVTEPKYYNSLGLYNKLVLFVMIFMFAHVLTTKIGKLFAILRGILTIILAKYFPVIFFFKYGFKGAYVNKYEEDIKDETRMKTNREMLAERKF